MNKRLSRRAVAKVIAQKLIDEPTRRSYWLQVLAAYILEQKLVGSVDLIVNDVLREVFVLNGEALVEVKTARPLASAMRTEITTMLREILDAKHIVMQEIVEPDLLGGFVVRTSDATLDASVRARLNQVASI